MRLMTITSILTSDSVSGLIGELRSALHDANDKIGRLKAENACLRHRVEVEYNRRKYFEVAEANAADELIMLKLKLNGEN